MEVTSLDPDRHVGWRCVRGPKDWVGTNFSFRLEPTPEDTVLLFTNADWREPVEFMHHCSTKWGYHLLGLKAGLEGGKATPFPDDMICTGPATRPLGHVPGNPPLRGLRPHGGRRGPARGDRRRPCSLHGTLAAGRPCSQPFPFRGGAEYQG